MDLVGSVETIVKLGLTIKEAVDTVRRNEEECSEIRERVLRVGDILSPLQETGSMDDSPAISGALEDLEKTLWRAHTLVEACQEKSTICLFCTAGKQSTQLRKVQDDITQKVMVVIFATNVQLTMILTRLDRPCPQTLVSLPGDSSVGHTLAFSRPARRAHPAPAPPQSSPATTPAFAVPRRRRPPPFASTAAQDGRSRPPPSKSTASCVQTINDYAGRVHASADQSCWRKFSSLELETATNHFSEDNLIGRGAFAAVFKGVLRDGLGVAIKKFKHPYQLPAAHINDVLSLVSKLQHKNIVKFIGYGYEVIEKVDGFDDNKHQAQESHYFLVEEYMPNGSLDDIIYGDICLQNILSKAFCRQSMMSIVSALCSSRSLAVCADLNQLLAKLQSNGLGWRGKRDKWRSYWIHRCMLSFS
ncbi:hypothetical protein SEVIR_8G234800v4 [Setaria viridis]|uniref:uncharacterized protein isoform X2 n=1 Tax=Setaria viridis TaxID=4556 RepID=UPI001493319D|nr:uncharacterized protein LOC117866498 isoform X2 [Setaria viridis]